MNGENLPSQCASLDELFEYTQRLTTTHFPNHSLKSIMGGGLRDSPEIMFVLINPTYANISSKSSWTGPRFPFIGTRAFWRVLDRAGMMKPELMEYINENKEWSIDFARKMESYFGEQKWYFTNIVKYTGRDAALPDTQKIEIYYPVLQREIELVNPQMIVAFGLIPFERMTGKKIKLQDYYEKILKKGDVDSFCLIEGRVPVIPCYFPVGRGNPARAVEMLKHIRERRNKVSK